MGIFRLAHSKYTAIPRSEATPTVVKLAVARSSDGDQATVVSNWRFDWHQARLLRV